MIQNMKTLVTAPLTKLVWFGFGLFLLGTAVASAHVDTSVNVDPGINDYVVHGPGRIQSLPLYGGGYSYYCSAPMHYGYVIGKHPYGGPDFTSVTDYTRVGTVDDSYCPGIEAYRTPPPPPPAACSNGSDDDGDGIADYPSDPGCSSASDTDEYNAPPPPPPPPPPACNDGIDNDGDGGIDISDLGCSSTTDNDEYNAPVTCSVGASSTYVQQGATVTFSWSASGIGARSIRLANIPSNSLNGSMNIQMNNAGYFSVRVEVFSGSNGSGTRLCYNTVNVRVVAPPPACSDGYDNDSDGAIDFGADSGCLSYSDTNEKGTAPTPNIWLDNSSIINGQSTNVNWSRNGHLGTCVVSQGIGTVTADGSQSVSPSTNTTYTITCTDTGSRYESPYQTTASVSLGVSAGPPSAPTNPVAVPQACDTDQLLLDWDDVSGAASYSIYYSNGTWVGNSLSSFYTFTGNPGEGHDFYVRANDSVGIQSSDSSTFSGTVPNSCPVVPASATIQADNCVIDPGNNTCSANVTWSSDNARPAVSVRQNGTEFSTSEDQPTGVSRTLTYGVNTFTFIHDGSEQLATDDGLASCSCGPACWNGSVCVAGSVNPNVALTVDKTLVRRGGSANLTWSSEPSYTGVCTVTGPRGFSISAPMSSGSASTGAISAKSEFVLSCEGGLYTDRVTVEVIGSIEEI